MKAELGRIFNAYVPRFSRDPKGESQAICRELRDELVGILRMLMQQPPPVWGDLPPPADPVLEDHADDSDDGAETAAKSGE